MDPEENIFNPSDSPEREVPPPNDGGNSLKICVHIRWMVRRDMAEVLEIEGHSFEFPWSEEDFIRCLKQRNCIGMVAEFEERIVGVMVYELQKTRLQLLNFAVHRDLRHRGIGAALISRLQSKCSPQRLDSILLEVRETNLAAQLFFRSCGFRATSVLRDFYEDTTEDAYLMQYNYQVLKVAEPHGTTRRVG